MNEYLYVMDYSDCTISRIDITDCEVDGNNIDEFLIDRGFRPDECCYMFSDKLIETVTKIVDEK